MCHLQQVRYCSNLKDLSYHFMTPPIHKHLSLDRIQPKQFKPCSFFYCFYSTENTQMYVNINNPVHLNKKTESWCMRHLQYCSKTKTYLYQMQYYSKTSIYLYEMQYYRKTSIYLYQKTKTLNIHFYLGYKRGENCGKLNIFPYSHVKLADEYRRISCSTSQNLQAVWAALCLQESRGGELTLYL